MSTRPFLRRIRSLFAIISHRAGVVSLRGAGADLSGETSKARKESFNKSGRGLIPISPLPNLGLLQLDQAAEPAVGRLRIHPISKESRRLTGITRVFKKRGCGNRRNFGKYWCKRTQR
jgi:hypothetical protein